MKVRLIIDGKTADLNEDGLILLTYQSTDAEHPAAVKTSYSQDITLPATPANDAIFSHILRGDFVTGTGFNPLARTPFEIRNAAQEILVSGYLKLNSGEVGKGYNVSLFGGLGGYFYSLMYNADGTKRTLADLYWPMPNADPTKADEIYIGVTASNFATRYNNALDEAVPYAFAPLDDGLPGDGFDAKKAYYKPSTTDTGINYQEIITSRDGYGPKNAAGGILVEMDGERDGWAMQEFRNTLQRPLWSIKAFLRAISDSTNTNGYAVSIDVEVFNSAFVQKGWVTLLNGWGDKIQYGDVTFADLLAGTDSPAEYLLSIAKICGLMFVYDEQNKSVEIVTRNTYFGNLEGSRLDLRGLIAEDREKVITPILTEDRWQVLSAEVYGAKAKDYAERKRRQYGSLWIDTNYEFGGNENEVLSDSIFKGAADVLASDIDYSVAVRVLGETGTSYLLKYTATGEVKYKLYKATSDGTYEDKTYDIINYWNTAVRRSYNSAVVNSNTIELPQLHDADGKGEEGNNVILFYNGLADFREGTASIGAWEVDYAVQFYATEDNADMLDLNEGTPCWCLNAPSSVRVMHFPIFQRQYANGTGSWSALFARPGEFFTPSSAYVNAVSADRYLGARTWQKWLAERCDVDVRKMRCWVNLRTEKTPPVDAILLRYFWYYDGAWWVLNKIDSHSLTTDDLTQCEFVKVIDLGNYTNGQAF